MTSQTATLRPHPAAALSSLKITLDELHKAQDDALMQVLAIAKLASDALDSDAPDAAANASNALAAIVRIAAHAADELDEAMVEISDARPYAAT